MCPSKSQVVHRDLAARNVLLDVNYVIKIADFGHARSVGTRTIYAPSANTAPVATRWMAPESIGGSPKFTTASDV